MVMLIYRYYTLYNTKLHLASQSVKCTLSGFKITYIKYKTVYISI